MPANVLLIAIYGGSVAAFFFIAAVFLTKRKFEVGNFPLRTGFIGILLSFGPKRTMNYSARTFVISGCVTLAITIGAILLQFFPLNGLGGLLIFALGALLLVAIYLSAAFDAISGDNPKTLKIATHNDEDLV